MVCVIFGSRQRKGDTVSHELKIAGYAWLWDSTKQNWERRMYRKCLQCKDVYDSELLLVLEGYPMCLHCLGQNVVMFGLDGHCRDCGRITRVLSEDDPSHPKT